MAFQAQQPGDIHATLAVSQDEAQFGSRRVINLPGGRTATVVVPPGTRDGQELRLTGQGSVSSAGGIPGDLILRVSVVAGGGFQPSGSDYATERALYSSLNGPASSGPVSSQNGPGQSLYAPPARNSSFASTPTDAFSGGVPYQQQAGGSPPYPISDGYQSNAMYGQRTPLPSTPYSVPASYQGSPPYGQTSPQNYPSPAAQPSRPKRSAVTTVLLVAIALVLIAGGVLVFYLGYYQPKQAQIAANSTAQAVQAASRAAASSTAQVVQATANAAASSTAQVQATALAYQNIYTQATSGTPVLDETLATPTSHIWDVSLGSSSPGGCAFAGGSYHSTISSAGFFQPCYAENTNFSTFAFQVNMTITKGDFGGILLRANSAHSKFYLFRIGVDGSFNLYNYTDVQASQAIPLLAGTSRAMKGLNQSNEITVVAQRTVMYFYLNRQYLGSTSDTSYTTGQIGVFAESAKTPTEAAFSHAKVWTL
jgi:type II secretory pathway pseudopilin PulG